jgi:hypothetical protein
MKPKVMITVQGGVIQSVNTNVDMDIVIIDYDNLKAGDKLKDIHAPDYIFKDGEAHELLQSLTLPLSKEEKQVKKFLKDQKF